MESLGEGGSWITIRPTFSLCDDACTEDRALEQTMRPPHLFTGFTKVHKVSSSFTLACALFGFGFGFRAPISDVIYSWLSFFGFGRVSPKLATRRTRQSSGGSYARQRLAKLRNFLPLQEDPVARPHGPLRSTASPKWDRVRGYIEDRGKRKEIL